MAEKGLAIEKRETVARLTLRRNTISGAMVRELVDACEALASDDDVRVVLLTGSGDVFSMGWDAQPLSNDDICFDPFGCLAEVSRPVLCALNGDALSAGLELALACDV